MENQTASKNTSLCSQDGSKNNASLYSQISKREKSTVVCNSEQSFEIPNQIYKKQQECLLSASALNKEMYQVHSYNNEYMNFTKEAYQNNKTVDMNQNSSLQNINIINKDVSTNCSFDNTQDLYYLLYQKILSYKKPNSWTYNKPQSLGYLLHPVLDTLVKLPEAEPFLQPVDALKVQDYYDIIKNPMDLSTIRKKLTSGQYQSGWGFIDDMWLMFNNAWLYNKKRSRVYKNCMKLSELFKSLIDNPMKKLGYCCGQYYEFEPSYIFCCIRQNCIISKYATYWNYDRYQICERCYSEFQGEVILRSSEGTISVSKEKFVARVNDVTKKEEFVECVVCKIKCHKICVQHFEDIWKDGYVCNLCQKLDFSYKVRNKFTSESLPQTKLGLHIENRVNCFLEKSGCNSRIIVRIVHQAQKTVHVKLGTKNRFVETGIWPDHFPYTSKTLLAFQQYDHQDVCFFAMFVQEYNSQCPYPNTCRAYISYLDSVHFFTPKNLKTAVYHEIFLGYLEYIRKLGFTAAHLWSCPSKKGEDYVFHCHPTSQKNPSIKQLLSWYKTMLDKGIEEGIVKCYKDIYRYAVDSKVKCPSELPYFEGDFWPNVLENEISELDRNSESDVCLTTEKTELSLCTEHGNKTANNVNEEILETKCKKNKKKIQKAAKNSNVCLTGDPLMDKLFVLLYKFREIFLVIEMESSSNLPAVVDPDPSIPSELLCTREIFLEFCRENGHEFSSLRRARYSTMVFLYELHKEKIATFSCNLCKKIIETRMHCKICKDFDLCSDCYNLRGHDHEMETVKAKPASSSYLSYIYHPIFLQTVRCADGHSSQCNDDNCPYSSCRKIKNLILHLSNCRNQQCFTCIWIFHLLKCHARRCKVINCFICKRIKYYFSSNTSKTFSACNEMCNNMSSSKGSSTSSDTSLLFSLDNKQLKECNIAENSKNLSSVNLFDITGTNKNLKNSDDMSETFPKSTAPTCGINGLFSSYAIIKSDFSKNSFSSTSSEQTLHNIPFNECKSERLHIVKYEDNVNNKKESTNTHSSLLLSSISSSGDVSSSVLKGENIENSAYLQSCNVSSSKTFDTKLAVLKASDLPQIPNSVKTSNYLSHQVKTDTWSNAQNLNSNIANNSENSFLCNLTKSSSKPANIEQKSLPTLSGSPVSIPLNKFNIPTSKEEKSFHESNKIPFITIDLNLLASKTDKKKLPETFNYESDKNFPMYLGTKPPLQNIYSSTKQESYEISPIKSNSFPVHLSNIYEDVKSMKPDYTSTGNISLTRDLEIDDSRQLLDPTKNVNYVFKIPQNFPYSVPTHTKVDEKAEILINKSVGKLLTKTDLNKSNTDYQGSRLRQTTSKVLYNKQYETINLPTLFHSEKVLNDKNWSNNCCFTTGVQKPTVHGNTNTSNAFQEGSSSKNHTSNEIFQPKYMNANTSPLKLIDNGEHGKIICNPNDYPSSHNLLIPSSLSNINIQSTATGHRFRNFSSLDNQTCNNILPNLNFSNDSKSLAEESGKKFDQSFNSNPITPPLRRKYAENSLNMFTGITDTITAACYKVAVPSNISVNQVSLSTDSSKMFGNGHSLQTSLPSNFPTKYLLINSTSVSGNSEILNSNDPKLSDNIVCTNLDQTGSNNFQALNFSVSEQSSHNIPKVTSCEPSANGKQVQFTKISFNKLSNSSVDAATFSNSYIKPNDFLGISQDFQSSNHTGSISMMPLNNVNPIKPAQVINDSNFRVMPMESSNQVLGKRGSEMNVKLNTNSFNQTGASKTGTISYSFPKNSSDSQPRKISTLQQHNYESFVTSDRIDLMNQNNPNFHSVGSSSENLRDRKPFVLKVSNTDSFEKNSTQESNMAESTVTSFPLVQNNTDFINTLHYKNVDAKKPYQDQYFKIPVNTSNEVSPFLDLNATAEPTINVLNNIKSPNVTVMYIQSAGKMNAKNPTHSNTSNILKVVHTLPASVNQDTFTLGSAEKLSPRSAIIKKSRHRFLRKTPPPNIISKKFSLQSCSSDRYRTLNPSVYSNHSGNLSCDINSAHFNSTSVAKNNYSGISYISSSNSSQIFSGCSKQFENQELKYVLNQPPETVNSKNVESIAFSSPTFSSNQCIYSMINNCHLGSTQNSLSTSTQNLEYHLSNSSVSKELCNVVNMSNYNIDSVVQNMQKCSNLTQKTQCNMYPMRSMKRHKEINQTESLKRPLKKCKSDMEYILNH